jgi:hypothetical protein
MANALYTHARDLFVGQSTDPKIDWVNDTIKACLVGSGYSFLATHKYLSDLGANVITPISSATTSSNLTGKVVQATGTEAGGAAKAAGITFSATNVPANGVTAGVAINFLVLYKDTGVAGTSPLIAFFDGPGGGVTGLPISAVNNTGQDVQVQWSSAYPYIFAI